MKVLFRWWSGIVFVAVIAQIGLAGVGAFHASKKLDKKGSTLSHDSFISWWNPHAALGFLLVLGAVLLVILAAIGRRDRLKWTGIVLGLFVVQLPLVGLGSAVPALGWLHPINALVIFAVTGSLAAHEWRARPAVAPAA